MTKQQAESEYRNEQLRLRAKTYLQYMFSLVYISVPPIPITRTNISITTYTVPTYEQSPHFLCIIHFSITTYAYVHIEATYKSGPPKTSNSLQHIHIYSTAGPNPDTEQQQPQIKKTVIKSHVAYNRNKQPSISTGDQTLEK